jgi:hypothetical protein
MIDWAFFDGVPARLNEQIEPYVAYFRQHQEAEVVVDKADENALQI